MVRVHGLLTDPDTRLHRFFFAPTGDDDPASDDDPGVSTDGR